MNDLEPPRDDLFVQRAILRGRARSARRRSVLLGAAAALVVAGAVGGGTWLVQNSSTGTSGTSAASGASAPERANDAATGGKASPSGQGLAPSAPSAGSPAVPPAGDPSRWFAGAATAQTAAFAAIEPELESIHSDVFSGAYAADASNTRIVVALTRPDPTVQSLVRSAMPSPDDVAFVTAAHSIGEKERLVAQIQADAPAWRAAGVTLIGLRLDGRTDRVVVTADEGPSPGWVAARYGPLVTVVP